MKKWQRTPLARRCGRCGLMIRKGDPMMGITLVSSYKVRCATCAGEPAPTDLPHVIERPPVTPLSFARFTKNSLPPDFKVAQAGDED